MKVYARAVITALFILFVAACNTDTSPATAPPTENSFSFSIDPQTQTVEILKSQALLQTLNNSLKCGLEKASVLRPNSDLALSHYDFAFLPNNQLKIIAKFKNVSLYAYADFMFERVTGKQILSSTEPAPVTLVASQEETAELEFLVHHKGKVFTYEVVAKAKVLCDTPVEEQLDFGDAPDGYGTTIASDGARHVITGSLIALGNFGESEDDGQPTVGADGDDLNGSDDEDALTNVPALSTTASSYSIDVLVNTFLEANPVYLVGWIDLNGNGSFDASEMSDVVVVTNGNNTLSWTDLSGQVAGSSYLRIRLSTTNGLGPTGAAPDGEVEDYPIDIVEPEPENGTIIIVNETIPDDPQSFSYILTDPFDLFSLVDDGTSPNSKLFEDVPPGSYAFTTTSYPGGSFALTDISCDDANSTDINVDGTNGGSLIINLEAGETVTCTFTSTKNPEPETGTIIIIKDTVPNNSQDFEFFTSGLSPESFMLDDDADPTLSNTQTFTNVPAGSYEIGEAVDNFVPAPGYEISSIVCDDPTNDTFISIPSAFIELSAGETVTCTFTNRLINADLEVKVEESDFSLAPEQYFVAPEYINHGPDTAENVSLTVTLPMGIVVVDVTGCNNTPVVSANQFICELGIVASGANGFIDIEFFLDNPSLTSLEFSAEIRSDTPDLVPVNNTDSNSFLLPAPELIEFSATKLRDDKVGSVSFFNDEKLAGWEFTLYDASNTQIAQGTTDANGVADLGSHPAGTYTWCETPQTGWENTVPGASTDPDPAGLGRPCTTRTIANTLTNTSTNFWNFELENQAPQITSYGGANPASDTVFSGASLVENLAATDDFDSEGAGLTWSITGGADGGGNIFGILPTTGVLVFNFFADFNNPQDVNGDNIYEVEVTVTDSGGLSDSLIINIEVIEAP